MKNSNLIVVTLKVNILNTPILKGKGCQDGFFKKPDQTISCLQEYKDTNSLKVKDKKKIYHANFN